MNIRYSPVCIGLAIALAVPASGLAAAPTSTDPIQLLANASGLTTRQVQMVLGNRTAFPEYLTGYEMVAARFARAVGPRIYRDVEDGRLTSADVHALTAMVDAHAKTARVAAQ